MRAARSAGEEGNIETQSIIDDRNFALDIWGDNRVFVGNDNKFAPRPDSVVRLFTPLFFCRRLNQLKSAICKTLFSCFQSQKPRRPTKVIDFCCCRARNWYFIMNIFHREKKLGRNDDSMQIKVPRPFDMLIEWLRRFSFSNRRLTGLSSRLRMFIAHFCSGASPSGSFGLLMEIKDSRLINLLFPQDFDLELRVATWGGNKKIIKKFAKKNCANRESRGQKLILHKIKIFSCPRSRFCEPRCDENGKISIIFCGSLKLPAGVDHLATRFSVACFAQARSMLLEFRNSTLRNEITASEKGTWIAHLLDALAGERLNTCHVIKNYDARSSPSRERK